MDINAINTLISKAFNNGKAPIRVGAYDEDTVGITVDRLVLWFIPEKLFIFDADKLRRETAPIDAKRLVPTDNLEAAVRTNELIRFEKDTLTVLKSENVEVFVNTKLLKVFDEFSTFKVTKPTAPVLVYENNILVGLVCPVKYSREV